MPMYSLSGTRRSQRLSSNLRPERPVETQVVSHETLECRNAELLEVTFLDIRCVVDSNPEVGGPLELCFVLGAKQMDVECIVHWKELRRQSWEVGLYLPERLPLELSSLVTDVRRKSTRYRCRVPGRFVSGDGGRCGDATVVNYSYDGFAIQSRLACRIEDQITFEWTCERSMQQIEAQVLWQIEQEGGVLLGCHTPPARAYRIAGLNIK